MARPRLRRRRRGEPDAPERDPSPTRFATVVGRLTGTNMLVVVQALSLMCASLVALALEVRIRARAAPPSPYFFYFSLATLTTVGSDDTLALHIAAPSLSTLEAAIGQLYPAIILARLVSLEVSQRDAKALRKAAKPSAHDNGRPAV